MKKVMKAIAAVMLMAAVVFTAGCTKPDEPNNGGGNNGGNGTYNGHDYIDLGLPSGTLWATYNVGATTPEGYGNYFAWGETEPKEVYDGSTYKWSNGYYNQLTKYCNNASYGYNGFTDNLVLLQSGDDAATVNWGNGWRTPTNEQWEELQNNTTSAWMTQNDVYGQVFYGNGQTLFLPVAGYRLGSELRGAGLDGYYWSSSLRTDSPNYAWVSGVDSVGCYMIGYDRFRGHSVRAVRSAQ